MKIDREPLPDDPMVSLLVAMKDEEANIGRGIASILAQDYPRERLEVIIADGGSTDRSVEVVTAAIAGKAGFRLVDNPRITQAAGWNLGIDLASGDVIGIVSGHVELAHDYVRAGVAALRRTGADMVGGPVRAISEGVVGEAVALATSSPFGVGGARFRYATQEERVDTVFMGISRAGLYRQLRFDEEMVRNQDDELSYRLLDLGGVIICDPAIQSAYRNRATLRGLWRQYFQYGSWKVRVIQKHPRQVRPRHLIPSAFVGSIVGGLVLSPLSPIVRGLTAAVAGIYGATILVAAARVGRGAGARVRLALPVVFGTLHLAYGTGLLVGLVRHRGRWTKTPPGIDEGIRSAND